MSESDDEAGYGKPPRHSQFKPGESGNRKGRPPGSRNSAKLLEELLFEEVQVKMGGRRRTMTALDAMVYATRNEALKGNPAAGRNLMKWADACGLIVAREAPPQAPAKSVYRYSEYYEATGIVPENADEEALKAILAARRGASGADEDDPE